MASAAIVTAAAPLTRATMKETRLPWALCIGVECIGVALMTARYARRGGQGGVWRPAQSVC